MSKLQLSVAIGNYDRMRPLVDGTVQIDGVDPQFMVLEPEEIFFRAFRQADFDICELSMSSYAVKTAMNTSPYIAAKCQIMPFVEHRKHNGLNNRAENSHQPKRRRKP